MKTIILALSISAGLLLLLACAQTTNANKNNTAPQSEKVMENLSLTDTSITKVVKTPEEWKKLLSPFEYYVLREQGTEPAFQNAYWNNHKEGHYFCRGCHLPLFSSNTKFESGTGWPSFFAPLNKSFVKEVTDVSHGMTRGEIVCARCEGHLGHVFDDGPEPTGLRYCMDSASLIFKDK